MAYCINCGCELSDDAKFCAKCGKAVVWENNSYSFDDGKLHKCPSCGSLLKAFVTTCPYCHYELRNVKTISSVNEFAKMLKEATTIEEKNECITNYYIPNTREDILDFFILAASNLESVNHDLEQAWRSKLEQAYLKAKISFGGTSEFERLESQYKSILSKVSKRSLASFVLRNKDAFIYALSIVLGLGIIAVGIFLCISFSDNGAGLGLGFMLFLLGFLIPGLIIGSIAENKEKIRMDKEYPKRKGNAVVQTIGKDPREFMHRPYRDVVGQFRDRGFNNIVLEAEKNSVSSKIGEVCKIIVAGNKRFRANDEFDVNSTVCIHYYDYI